MSAEPQPPELVREGDDCLIVFVRQQQESFEHAGAIADVTERLVGSFTEEERTVGASREFDGEGRPAPDGDASVEPILSIGKRVEQSTSLRHLGVILALLTREQALVILPG